MKRHVGVSAIKKKQEQKEAFTSLGKASKEEKLIFVKDTLQSFHSALAEFASKHKNKINADPEFRQQFHKMCQNIGVDPLASSKGFWAEILGVGDYYYELGVSITSICMQSRSSNGGIISVAEVLEKIRSSGAKSRSSVSIEDIQRAVEKLAVLGSGFRILPIGNTLMIVSVPVQLNKDHELLLEIARSSGNGSVSWSVVQAQQWTRERFHLNINDMLKHGMLWVDMGEGARVSLFYDIIHP